MQSVSRAAPKWESRPQEARPTSAPLAARRARPTPGLRRLTPGPGHPAPPGPRNSVASRGPRPAWEWRGGTATPRRPGRPRPETGADARAGRCSPRGTGGLSTRASSRLAGPRTPRHVPRLAARAGGSEVGGRRWRSVGGSAGCGDAGRAGRTGGSAAPGWRQGGGSGTQPGLGAAYAALASRVSPRSSPPVPVCAGARGPGRLARRGEWRGRGGRPAGSAALCAAGRAAPRSGPRPGAGRGGFGALSRGRRGRGGARPGR